MSFRITPYLPLLLLLAGAPARALQDNQAFSGAPESLPDLGLAPQVDAAAQLRLAESYITQFGHLAKQGNSLIIPSDIADAAGMVAAVSKIIKPGEGLGKSGTRS